MTSRPPVCVASRSLVLSLALAAASFTAPAAAEPPRSWLEEGAVVLTPEAEELLTPRRLSGSDKPEDSHCLDALVRPLGEEDGKDRRPRLRDMKGKLRPPVTGTLVRPFGGMDGRGRPSNGIVLRAKPGAQVVAPFDSTIMFAGPYSDYGQLLILSAGGGYHFILAGMTKIYGVECQKLLEGEPVGVMGSSEEGDQPLGTPRAAGTGGALIAGAGPELYFEIRENGKPVDPLPWLATARLERTLQ